MVGKVNRLISVLLVFSMLLSLVGCAKETPKPTLSDPNSKVASENVEAENTITEKIETENILTESITEEVYLEELIVAEQTISEMLLEEDTISEVLMCKTIYVPEEHIEDFSEHSQTAKLFGDGVDIAPVLKKAAIGTGVIVTLVIVKKVGVPQPIASIVASAVDESVKAAGAGAGIGTLFGGFTGAANEIDSSGRTTAIAGFALATVGVIVTAISFVGAVPSGGTSGFGIAEGIHLAWAGVKLIGAAVGISYASRDMVKAFTDNDASEIDWNNINWDKVGVSAAQKAIQNGADGYMWGAIYGAVDGTVEGYYQKYCTPYTKYADRLKHTPKDGNGGKWTGVRGESEFVLDTPIELPDGTKIIKISYQNAVPDFSPYEVGHVKIANMTNSRSKNFRAARQELRDYWNKIKFNGESDWTIAKVKAYEDTYNLTWHEMSNMEQMQLVPFEVNDTFTHYGGVAEYNAMTGQKGAGEFE